MKKNQVISDALWVDVGDYTVLRNGRILKRNWHRTGKTREVKQYHDHYGYLNFSYNGKIVKSHRFIAEAFISNPENLPEINHKLEMKDSNDVLGLEWCDRGYNNRYGTRNERVSKTLTNGRTSKRVFQYALDGTFIREWPSTQEVERRLGYFSGNISNCCLGKQKTAYNYIWKYAE